MNPLDFKLFFRNIIILYWGRHLYIATDRDLLIKLVESRFASEKKIAIYSNYIDYLFRRELPPILSFRHLADIFSLPLSDFYKICFNTRNFYSKFCIPKRSGGFREISKPYQVLAEIQDWIAKYILKTNIDVFSKSVTGYIPGKSIIDHVKPHQESECVAKFDIRDFFPSITTVQICSIFLNLGYNKSVSRTLASLVTLDGELPQGACTSPYLSNVRLVEFDEDFEHICARNDLIYTRYADDVVISGATGLLDILDELRSVFWRHGFSINEDKTKIYRLPSQTRFITGLTINKGEIRIPKAMRRKIRAQAHIFLRDFSSMMNGRYQNSEFGQFIDDDRADMADMHDPIFVERILGKLNYWICIEPANEYPKIVRANINKMLTDLV